MVIIRLKAGMGNQMFQYAFAKRVALHLNTRLKIDCSLLLDRARGKHHVYRDYDLSIFKLNDSFVIKPKWLRLVYKTKSSVLGKLLRTNIARGLKYEKEKHFHVDEPLIDGPTDKTIYEGWWQSWRYFQDAEQEIRKAFEFKESILPASQGLYNRILNCNSICLNVRRTDFLKTPELNATNKDYFFRAVKVMAEHVDNPCFYIFSDDIAWCKSNLKLEYPTEIVSHEHKGHKFGNYLQLMKACKHFIIPNSSFAWWAVWLNGDINAKVIAPKDWFMGGKYDTSDLIPDHWIRL